MFALRALLTKLSPLAHRPLGRRSWHHPLRWLLVGLLVTSCNPLQSFLGVDRTVEPIEGAQGDTPRGQSNVSSWGRVVTDPAQRIQLTLPSGWQEDRRLHETANLQTGNFDRNLYVIVLAEDKGQLGSFTLENNSEYYRRFITEAMSSVETQERTDVTRISGTPVVQYEMRGRINGVPVVYLHTTLATNDRYYQILGWTSPENFNAYQDELQSVINSFQVI